MLLYLAKWFQRRRFLEIDQPETRIAYGGHVCVQPSLKKNSSLYKADLKHRNRKHKM